jgi:eukaryotic-like serine/threonine-protein kinase
MLCIIGRGGMGEVYEAEDLELGGRVALKTIRPGLLQDGHAVARFRREIQLSRQVTHTNICRVFDVGHDELDGRDLLFLTMEYLEGETLTSYLARNGSVPEAMALALGRQIAAGLDALHERGVVHRDLKPGNVMLWTSDSGAQRAVIMDFGLAREFETEAAETVVTRQGVVLGTPAYMAPEQRSGQSVTPASDVYSFGLVLYEMITGRKARPGLQKPGQTGLPERWDAVVLRCLEIDADARPKSASQALEGFDGPARKPPRWLAFGALAFGVGRGSPFPGTGVARAAGWLIGRGNRDWQRQRRDTPRARIAGAILRTAEHRGGDPCVGGNRAIAPQACCRPRGTRGRLLVAVQQHR